MVFKHVQPDLLGKWIQFDSFFLKTLTYIFSKNWLKPPPGKESSLLWIFWARKRDRNVIQGLEGLQRPPWWEIKPYLGGETSNMFFFHPEPWGDDSSLPGVSWSNLTYAYFSDGLVKNHQPVTLTIPPGFLKSMYRWSFLSNSFPGFNVFFHSTVLCS